MASSSSSTTASPSINSNSNYDVFLNHRGADVKKTLASHLYYRLRDRGFQVFLDKQEMQKGGNLNSQIKGAIATASVHIAIFSPGYAHSRWCLDELVLMLQSKGTVIPVFYDVKPSDLRIRTGSYGMYARVLTNVGWTDKSEEYANALRIHEKKKRYEPKTIAEWKQALFSASLLSGVELKEYNGDEGELLDRVVQLVEDKVRKPELDVAKYPAGLDEKLQDFDETILQQQRHRRKTKVVGILGTAGIGKTTLAIEFFNRKRSAYHQSCFLQDVRDETCLMSLQNKLHRGLTSRDLKISSIADGRGQLSHRLSGSKALIILDDVDHAHQLDALFEPVKDVLHSDSLILITSRNKDVLSRIEASPIYKMTGLNKEHSLELFCSHAFHKPQPVVGFEEVVAKYLDACDGLPLSLEVLGSELYQKDLEYWKARLLKISHDLVLPPDIQSSLKISYDSLDSQEREIFFDIACFLIEEDRDLAIRIWDGSGWKGRLNLQNLEHKCLLEIDGKNCIRMHNHFRDLGRNFSEKELPTCHRRLWRRTENLLYNAFRQPTVRGITMVQETSGQSIHNHVELGNFSVDMSKLHLLKAEGDCLESISNFLRHSDQLLWLCWNKYPYNSLPSWIRTRNLRVLQVAGCQLNKLWDSESEASLKLEHFEMKDATVPLPEDFCHVRTLKHLRLQTTMMSLPDSFRNLTNLKHIDFSRCADLHMLPESFGDLRDVQHVSLNGCFRLEMLPPCFGNLPLLKHLDLQETAIKKLSFPEGLYPSLQHLNISFCHQLEEVGPLPTTLISLDLRGCSAWEKIIGLPGLERLRLLEVDISGYNKIEELIDLQNVDIVRRIEGASECKKLKETVRRQLI